MTRGQRPTIAVSPGARMMTIANVAQILGVSKMTVHRLVGTGALRGYKIGRSIRVRADDLTEFLRAAEVGGAS